MGAKSSREEVDEGEPEEAPVMGTEAAASRASLYQYKDSAWITVSMQISRWSVLPTPALTDVNY